MIHPHLDHIGIAVKSISDALAFYQDALGIEVGEREEIVTQKVRVLFLETGETRTELLEPSSEDSPIAHFIEKRGEGLHHIAYRVESLIDTMASLEQSGCRLVYPEPRPGSHGTRINFIHPSSGGGILVELVEYTDEELGQTSEEEPHS